MPQTVRVAVSLTGGGGVEQLWLQLEPVVQQLQLAHLAVAGGPGGDTERGEAHTDLVSVLQLAEHRPHLPVWLEVDSYYCLKRSGQAFDGCRRQEGK